MARWSLPAAFGHYVECHGENVYVPVILRREDGCHIVECESTGHVLGRISRVGSRWSGWVAQDEVSGKSLPTAYTRNDALFDLLQFLADRRDERLGLGTWGMNDGII